MAHDSWVRRVWVTRPRGRADGLCQALTAAGKTPIRLPALYFGPPRDLNPLKQVFAGFAGYHGVIFVSATAAAGLGKYWPVGRAWPQQTASFAVGRATADAVLAAGFPAPTLSATGSDSESLLALAELQSVADRKLLIVRGNGGRELLAETLRARGAQVDYVETYTRTGLARLPAELCRLGRRGAIDLLTSTSNQTLDSILAATGEQDRNWLLALALVVSAQRQKQHALELGFRGPIRVAAGSDDRAMLAAIEQF